MSISRNKTFTEKQTQPRGNRGWAALSYLQKFGIIALIFLMPLVAFSPILYEQIVRIDRYGTREAQGAQYLRTIWQLANGLQSYHTANIKLQNGTGSAEDATAALETIEQSLQAARTQDEIAENLSLTTSADGLRAKWEATRDDPPLLLIDELASITREVGDKSYLILDPDLDTYYLMDIVLIKLPENQSLLFQSNLLLESTFAQNRLTLLEENQLLGYLNALERNLTDISRGLTVAAQNNSNEAVPPTLQGEYNDYRTTLEAYIAGAKRIVEEKRFAVEDMQATRLLHQNAVSEELRFYTEVSTGLETGIQNRIAFQGGRLLILFSFTIISTLVAISIGGRLMRSISTPLQKTIQAAEQFAGGNTAYRIDYEAGDEAGKVILAFNSMASEIENIQSALQQRSIDLEDKTRKLETIAKVAHEITSIRELGVILERSTELIYENFGHYHVGIFLLDERKEYAVLTATNSAGGRRMLEKGHTLKVGETGIVGYVAENLAARIALDVGGDAVYFNNPDLPETRSEMALPLVVSGQILGVLDVQSTEPRAFGQEDISIIQILADQLAVAISNANLYGEAVKAIESARATYGQISREAWSKMLRSQDHIAFLATPPATIPLQNAEINPVIAKAIETGDLILGEDGTTISVPVKIRGQVIGAIRLKKSGISGAWTQDETNLAIALSDQLSGALESARLYRESLQRAARESLVSEISSRITASATRDIIVRETVQELGQSIGNVSVTFQLLEQPNGEKQTEAAARAANVIKSE